MPYDLEGHRIQVPLIRAVKSQLRRNAQGLGWHVRLIDPVKCNVPHFADSLHSYSCLPDPALFTNSSKFPKPSTLRRCPGRATTVVSGVSTTAGPVIELPGRRRVPSYAAVSSLPFTSSQ